jgi:hypothetical protein
MTMGLKSNIAIAVVGVALLGGIGIATAATTAGSTSSTPAGSSASASSTGAGAAASTGTAAPASTGTVAPSSTGTAAPSSTGTAATATAPTPSCLGQHDDGWPLAVDGRPAGLDAGDHGIYLWHDVDGWHLRITHANDNARLYTGEITTDGTLTAQPVRLEQDDRFVIGPQSHELVFAFVNYNGIDGIDFQTSCAQYLRFNFQVDGYEAPSAEVHIGADGRDPADVPFTVVRHA